MHTNYQVSFTNKIYVIGIKNVHYRGKEYNNHNLIIYFNIYYILVFIKIYISD